MPTTCDQPRPLAEMLATRHIEIFSRVLQSHGFAYREPDSLPALAGCHGCSWTHPVADQSTAQRLHTLHIIEVLQANWVGVELIDGDVAKGDPFGHFDRIADTGDGYDIVGCKHVVRCICCGTTFLGDTPEDAENAYRAHEEQLRRIDEAQRMWAHTGAGDPQLWIRDSYLPHNYQPRAPRPPETTSHR